MLKKTLLASTISLLTACGGGSGGTSNPQAPEEPQNRQPIIELGENLTVNEKQQVLIIADVNDPDGDTVAVTWEQVKGYPLGLGVVEGSKLEFLSPEVDQDTNLTFQATVTDSKKATSVDTVDIVVKNVIPPEPENIPPKVTVGESFEIKEDSLATKLSATAEDVDGEIVEYKWTQIEGPAVILNTPFSLSPDFGTPLVDEDTPLIFEFTATDDKGAKSSAQQTVTILNDTTRDRPVIEVEVEPEVIEGEVVNLTATVTDADGTIVDFYWRQTAGPDVVFSDKAARKTQITIPAYDENDDKIRLIARAQDNDGNNGWAEVTLTVKPSKHSFALVNYTDQALKTCIDSERVKKSWKNILDVTDLSCSSFYKIQSLKDLEQFPNLTSLSIYSRELKDYQGSYIPQLDTLNLVNTPVTSLNLEGAPSLKSLTLREVRNLAELKLEHNPDIESLYITKARLNTIDVTQLSKLKTLVLNAVQATNVKVNGLTNLETLALFSPAITGIDLSELPSLSKLTLTNSRLEKLDLSGAPNLTGLNVSNGKLTDIDLSHTTQITALTLSLNQLNTVNVSMLKQLETLMVNDNPQLATLELTNNTALKQLNIARLPKLAQLNVDVSKLTYFDADNTYVASVDLNQLQGLTRLGLTGWGLTALDVTKHTTLESLSVEENQLKTLDVSNSPLLKVIEADDNQIETLSLANNPLLQRLSVSKNTLTTIQFGHHERLTVLDVSENKINAIDVSQMIGLEQLYLNGNPIDTIDTDALIDLSILDVSSTQITTLNVDALDRLWCVGGYNTPLDQATKEALQRFSEGQYKAFIDTLVPINTTLFDVCFETVY